MYVCMYVYIYIYIYIPCSMTGIFTNTYPINDPNIGKYLVNILYMEHMGIYIYIMYTLYCWMSLPVFDSSSRGWIESQ